MPRDSFCRIDADTVQPGIKRAVSAKAWQGAIRLDEGFLGDIFDFAGSRMNQRQQTRQPALVFVYQKIKSPLVPRCARLTNCWSIPFAHAISGSRRGASHALACPPISARCAWAHLLDFIIQLTARNASSRPSRTDGARVGKASFGGRPVVCHGRAAPAILPDRWMICSVDLLSARKFARVCGKLIQRRPVPVQRQLSPAMPAGMVLIQPGNAAALGARPVASTASAASAQARSCVSLPPDTPIARAGRHPAALAGRRQSRQSARAASARGAACRIVRPAASPNRRWDGQS